MAIHNEKFESVHRHHDGKFNIWQEAQEIF
jgi:hypothetical protein